MKIAFLLVCLLNLILFFWELHNGAFTPKPEYVSGLPSFLLTDEMERARRGVVISALIDQQLQDSQSLLIELTQVRPIDYRALAERQRPPEHKPQLACYELGPFPNRKTAYIWMQGHSLTGEIISREAPYASSFLVYYPASKDAKQNRLHKMLLSAKGFNSVPLIAGGELKGAFNLGSYSDRAKAENFQNKLLKDGLPVEIQERYQTRNSIFVRVTAKKEHLPQTGDLSVELCESQHPDKIFE